MIHISVEGQKNPEQETYLNVSLKWKLIFKGFMSSNLEKITISGKRLTTFFIHEENYWLPVNSSVFPLFN